MSASALAAALEEADASHAQTHELVSYLEEHGIEVVAGEIDEAGAREIDGHPQGALAGADGALAPTEEPGHEGEGVDAEPRGERCG